MQCWVLHLHSTQLSFSSDKSYLPGNYWLSPPEYSEEQFPSVWSKHHSQPMMPSLKPWFPPSGLRIWQIYFYRPSLKLRSELALLNVKSWATFLLQNFWYCEYNLTYIWSSLLSYSYLRTLNLPDYSQLSKPWIFSFLEAITFYTFPFNSVFKNEKKANPPFTCCSLFQIIWYSWNTK